MTKLTNNTIEELKKEIESDWQHSPSMIKYCCGKISNALLLENGYILEFEKKSIKKTFCFGVGMYATCTDEEQAHGSAMVDKATKDKNYFIEENFNEAFGFIEKLLKEKKEGWHIYAQTQNKEKNLRRCYLIGEKTLLYRDELKENYYKLTDYDIENLKYTLEQEKEKFLKRLNTYLKKYGLSKVNSWSYIVD